MNQPENIFSSPTPCTVIFDTCSILKGDEFAFFMKKLIPTNHTIVILNSVIDELQYLAISKTTSTTDCRVEALRALAELQVLTKIGIISVEGDSGCHQQADFSILKYISVRRFDSQKLVVVTQDRQLAEDILKLNKTSTLPTLPPVSVYRIGKDGKQIQILDDNCQKSNTNDILFKRFGIA